MNLEQFTKNFNTLDIDKNFGKYKVKVYAYPLAKTNFIDNFYLCHGDQSVYLVVNFDEDPLWQQVKDLYLSQKAITEAKELLERKGYKVTKL